MQLKPHLRSDAIIIIDDGYMPDDSHFVHAQVLKKAEMLQQIDDAGLQLMDEIIALEGDAFANTYDREYELLSKRCDELAAAHPDNTQMFHSYKQQQKMEYANLKSEITCVTMVIGRK